MRALIWIAMLLLLRSVLFEASHPVSVGGCSVFVGFGPDVWTTVRAVERCKWLSQNSMRKKFIFCLVESYALTFVQQQVAEDLLDNGLQLEMSVEQLGMPDVAVSDMSWKWTLDQVLPQLNTLAAPSDCILACNPDYMRERWTFPANRMLYCEIGYSFLDSFSYLHLQQTFFSFNCYCGAENGELNPITAVIWQLDKTVISIILFKGIHATLSTISNCLFIGFPIACRFEQKQNSISAAQAIKWPSYLFSYGFYWFSLNDKLRQTWLWSTNQNILKRISQILEIISETIVCWFP